MAKSEHLRQLAERMLALAMDAGDAQLTEWLSKRAGEYLDEAQALEAAVPPIVETPERAAQQAQRPAAPENPEKRA